MKKKIFVYSVIAIVVVAGFMLMTNRNTATGITVRTAEAVEGDLSSYLSTTGIVASQDSREYYGVQGKVLEVHAEVGHTVESGTLLVTYETQDLESAVRQAEIQYQNAVLQRDELIEQNEDINEKIQEYDEQITALEAENIDRSVIEPIENQRDALTEISPEGFAQAENAIQLAQISLEVARDNLQKNESTLVAEAGGVVTEVNVVEGAVATGAQPAMVVQNIEDLKVVVSLGRYDAEKIQVGQPVEIKNAGEVYLGEVTFIDPVAKRSATGTETFLEIEISVLEKAPNLKIAFETDVDILTGKIEQGVIVPLESVKMEKGDRTLIYVLKNGIVEEREVELGLQSPIQAEVLSGIEAGDFVILMPSESVVSGVAAMDQTEGAQ